MKIAVFTAGGTIDKTYFDAKGGYEVGVPMAQHILGQARIAVDISITEILRKDSLEMSDADRALIRTTIMNCTTNHVIVTHGTDTMTETARALEGLPDRVIVLTGALQPARFADSDGPFNLGMAIAAVQTLGAGVYIAANGLIFPADRVRKNRRLDRFELIEGKPRSSSSPGLLPR